MKDRRSTKQDYPKLDLPTAIELAYLASRLGPRNEPRRALDRAFRWYLTACAYLEPIRERYDKVQSREEFLSFVRLNAGEEPLMHWQSLKEKGVFLDPEARNDSLRIYLKESGLSMLNAKTVIRNFRKWLDAGAPCWLDSFSLERQNPRLFDYYMGPCEYKGQVYQGWWESRNGSGNKAYEVPKRALDGFIKWRRQLKHEGGLKSVATAHRRKEQKIA
jgi:hypothetical protein